MASVQYGKHEEIAMQLSFKEKAKLDEIIKRAKSSLGYQGTIEIWDKDFAAIGELQNEVQNEEKSLSVMKTYVYSGDIEKDFPDPLKGTQGFAMSAMNRKGVKAAVVYCGMNKANVDCGWLIAFANTRDTGMRIYAECGKKDKFNYIDWETVEIKLNRAGTAAKASDEETKTSLYARIEGFGGKSIVGAAFDG